MYLTRQGWRDCVQILTKYWLRPGMTLLVLLLSAGVCHADGLREKVLQAFQSQASELRVIAKTEDELQVTGRNGPLVVYLFNLRAACVSSKGSCEGEVSSFVRRIALLASSGQPADVFVAEKIYAVLRNADFAKHAAETVKEPNKQLVALPFVESIEVLFVVDGKNEVRFVNRGDLVAAGLTERALLDLASHNASRLPQLKYEPINDAPGLYVMRANDGLGTSRAFDVALWEKLEAMAGVSVAMAVPTRDWVIFSRADKPGLVAKLRDLAGRIARGEPYAVSDAVMVRDGKGWKALQHQ